MKSRLVTFRIKAEKKEALGEAAERAGVTISELLRRAGRATGRFAPRGVPRA
ncbi:MAG: ribbon-helix-helix protein, CopG family [Rhizobiales bacterium]|nr:ribbon-helix-helix protein, CopG family [Hyphomicrobiales bacterium]